MEFVSSSKFIFPGIEELQTLNVDFKKMCFRLRAVSSTSEIRFVRCLYCRNYTCNQNCLEDRCSKVVVDIGSKFTWVITANFGLKRHLSMIGVPKQVKCVDCDTKILRTQPISMASSFCGVPSERFSCCRPGSGEMKLSQHTGLQYYSQDVQNIDESSEVNTPFCIFCNQSRVSILIEERHHVQRRCNIRDAVPCENDLTELSNGFCKDTSKALKISNVDVVSPSSAMRSEKGFLVLKAYLQHLLYQLNLLEDLRRPNNSLLFCIPIGMPKTLKVKLLSYLFIKERISR